MEEVKVYKIDFLGVNESRKKRRGLKTLDNDNVLKYVGSQWEPERVKGVAFMVTEDTDRR